MTEPDDLDRAREELGDPDALYRISPAWLRGKLALGVLLVAAGAGGFGLFWAAGGRGAHVFHWVVAPVAAGVGLLVNLYKQRGLSVLVYPTGLLRLRRGEVESFPWGEITEVRLKAFRAGRAELDRGPDGGPVAAWLPAEVPTVQVWNAGLTVVRADGTRAEFSPVLAGFADLAAEVQRRTFPHLWAAALDRFLDGRMLDFGKLEASLAGLHHGGKLLPWPEVGKLSIARGQLAVSQNRKWLPWAVVKPTTDIPNLHVLFALATYAAGDGPGPDPGSE